uniref:Secreted protein n=1 Tax=Plectus sambesii TaxID=2011161 RepID=A0A914WQI0_9BILA
MLLRVAVLFLLFAGANACGCYGCFYTEQSSCARCCTAFIKRSSVPALSDRSLPNNGDGSLMELVRRLGGARFRSPYRASRLEDFINGDRFRRSDSLSLFRRDTCGCAMGCFFAEPTDCVRCCSQALRRNTNSIQRSEAEQGLTDILDVISNPVDDTSPPPSH